MIYSSVRDIDGTETCDEATASKTGLYIENGYTLMGELVNK
jgi:hypothetical protein